MNSPPIPTSIGRLSKYPVCGRSITCGVGEPVSSPGGGVLPGGGGTAVPVGVAVGCVGVFVGGVLPGDVLVMVGVMSGVQISRVGVIVQGVTVIVGVGSPVMVGVAGGTVVPDGVICGSVGVGVGG